MHIKEPVNLAEEEAEVHQGTVSICVLLQTPACVHIVFCGLPKTTNEVCFRRREKKWFFPCTGRHLCNQMARKYHNAAWQQLISVRSWRLPSKPGSSHLPAEVRKRNILQLLQQFGKQLCGMLFMVILLTGGGNSFTLVTKESSIPSKPFEVLANKTGLNGKLVRLDTSSQSLPYYSTKPFSSPSSKIWSQFYTKHVNSGTTGSAFWSPGSSFCTCHHFWMSTILKRNFYLVTASLSLKKNTLFFWFWGNFISRISLPELLFESSAKSLHIKLQSSLNVLSIRLHNRTTILLLLAFIREQTGETAEPIHQLLHACMYIYVIHFTNEKRVLLLDAYRHSCLGILITSIQRVVTQARNPMALGIRTGMALLRVLL